MSIPVSSCAWCRNPESDFDPMDLDDAEQTLCITHTAEWAGTSIDGLQREQEHDLANMADLGYFD